MRWEDVKQQTCSISRSVAIFGDSWTLLIVRQIFLRIRRFSDIQKSLGITKHRLADRLSRLVDEGILYKHLYDEKLERYEYRLTDKGIALYPILLSIARWGNEWVADEDGPPVEYLHKSCGHVTEPILICNHCGDEIVATDMSVSAGPGIREKLKRGELNDRDTVFYGTSFQIST